MSCPQRAKEPALLLKFHVGRRLTLPTVNSCGERTFAHTRNERQTANSECNRNSFSRPWGRTDSLREARYI